MRMNKVNNSETVKTKFWAYHKNNGDGSVSSFFYPSREAAEKEADTDDERYCDDISFYELEFDMQGNLVSKSGMEE